MPMTVLATKDHVNVFIYDPTVPDADGVINQGHGNATAKAVQIYRGDEINRRALLDLFKAVIANNRDGDGSGAEPVMGHSRTWNQTTRSRRRFVRSCR